MGPGPATAVAAAGGVRLVRNAVFHFAKAALLPLVGKKLAHSHPALAVAMMLSCIIAA